MSETTNKPPLPDHLSIDPRSPHYAAAVFEHEVGIRFNGVERNDVEEYRISEGWVRVPHGPHGRPQGQPGDAQPKGRVEAFYR